MSDLTKDLRVELKGRESRNVRGFRLQSIQDFRADKEGISNQALGYAFKHDLVDFIKIGKVRIIVMTEKSRKYAPNPNPLRP